MTSSAEKFNSLVYPIQGNIRLEVDNIHRLPSCSEQVKVGKCEWRVYVERRCSEKTDHEKYLGVYLRCCSRIEKGKSIKTTDEYRLINQHKPEEGMKKKGTNEYTGGSLLRGDTTFMKWWELMSDGYVKDDKIIVEFSLIIESEDEIKRRRIDFKEERPNIEDKMMMLERKMNSKMDQLEEEVEIAEISEYSYFTEPNTVFGLPTKLCFEKDNEWLKVYLCLNWEDKSEWWMGDVQYEFEIVNWNDENLNFAKSLVHLFNKKYSIWGKEYAVMKWNELVDPSNGFIKNGQFKVKVSVRILESYGFDEQTNRGIERPMRRMTDTVLVVGGKRLKVTEKILAQQSIYFRELFDSNSGENVSKKDSFFRSLHNSLFAFENDLPPGKAEFNIENVKVGDFVRFLELVHNVDTDICEENAREVLDIIKRFEAPECFERCDRILKTQELKDTMQVLEWVDRYPLPELRSKFLLKLKDEELLKSITHSGRYKSLSDKMKVAILEWMLVPEESRTEENESLDYQFDTDFGEKTQLTDVEIEVDGYSYYASKQILSNASHFFMKRFYGPYSEDEPKISLFDVVPLQFEKLLTHIYHPTRPVTLANIDSLLHLAHQFSVPRLMDKCEEYLVLNDSIQLIDKLDYAGKYDLPYLLNACSKWAKDTEKMREVRSHWKFPNLTSHVVAALLTKNP